MMIYPNQEDESMRRHYLFLALMGMLLCVVVIWLSWQGVQTTTAFLGISTNPIRDHGPAWAEVNIAKPDSSKDLQKPGVSLIANEPASNFDTGTGIGTPEPAITPLPTDTPSIPPGITPTITLQGSSGSSAPDPTDIPFFDPTSTPTTAGEPATATPEIAVGASPTPLPTDTSEPYPTPGQSIDKVVTTASSGRWIDVDLTNQMVYAYEGNTIVNSFLVSTGLPNTPTVTGQYYIYIKLRQTDMYGPGYYLPDVPFVMYFFEGYGFHGTYWHNNFGTPMSRGCVNMRIPEAEWLFDFASVGTLVNIHY